MSKIRWHKDADPNDPRYVALAGPLPSLNEDPELPVEAKEEQVVQVVANLFRETARSAVGPVGLVLMGALVIVD